STAYPSGGTESKSNTQTEDREFEGFSDSRREQLVSFSSPQIGASHLVPLVDSPKSATPSPAPQSTDRSTRRETASAGDDCRQAEIRGMLSCGSRPSASFSWMSRWTVSSSIEPHISKAVSRARATRRGHITYHDQTRVQNHASLAGYHNLRSQ